LTGEKYGWVHASRRKKRNGYSNLNYMHVPAVILFQLKSSNAVFLNSSGSMPHAQNYPNVYTP